MGMWPFWRRSQRRKNAGGAGISQPDLHNAGIQQDPASYDGPELATAGPERRKSRRDTKRKSSRESKKLQRDSEKRDKRRTYSFSPGRNDSIRVARALDRPPVPALPPNWKGKGRASTEKQSSGAAGTKPIRSSTQPPENTQNWQRMPTLQKRSAQEMARRKSSKKRKGEHDREAEIKAMSAFMPTRLAVDYYSHGRSMRRQRDPDHPSSDVSLPLADSLRSSFSGHDSQPQTNYVVSAFDMLAPRPTLRYSENPRYVPGASGFGSPNGSRRRSERLAIAEDTLKAHKRVDELADDLDAGELRELMERDQKRREKKRIAEQIKMQQRLARRQAKQTADEAEAARNGTPPPVNMDRGVLGRDIIGLGIGTSAIVTSNKRKSSTGSDDGRGKRPAESFRQDSTTSAFDGNFHRSASLITENLTPDSERSDPVIETATVGTVAKASVSPTLPPKGHTRGQSSISQMLDLSHSEAPQPSRLPEPTVQHAATTPVKTPSSWTSFFKLRGAKSKRPTPPSSFSNTSRDSMHPAPAPQAIPIGYTPMRSMSNVPKRTMSKFREDLPELPLSPPDSRVQSPEADMVPPIRTDYAEKRTGIRASTDDPRVRYDTPTSGYRSPEATRLRNETPTSEHRTMDVPSPEPVTALSQSLASIDSEGSWLSGRRAGSKRGSSQLAHHAPIQDSSSSLNKKYKEFNESAEELGIAQDEYFSRLTPGPEEENMINRRSGTLPSSDDDEGGSISSPVPSEKTKWGALGRHPTVVHRSPRAKSTEGLLTQYDDEDLESGPSSPSSPTDSKAEAGLQRAKSVDLGKSHVRHISAGSARLLDLKPRSSVDSRRDSRR